MIDLFAAFLLLLAALFTAIGANAISSWNRLRLAVLGQLGAAVALVWKYVA